MSGRVVFLEVNMFSMSCSAVLAGLISAARDRRLRRVADVIMMRSLVDFI